MSVFICSLMNGIYASSRHGDQTVSRATGRSRRSLESLHERMLVCNLRQEQGGKPRGRAVSDSDINDVYDRAGFGAQVRRGRRPAVVVIDFSRGFTEPQYGTGSDLSDEVTATRRLLDTARDAGVP